MLPFETGRKGVRHLQWKFESIQMITLITLTQWNVLNDFKETNHVMTGRFKSSDRLVCHFRKYCNPVTSPDGKMLMVDIVHYTKFIALLYNLTMTHIFNDMIMYPADIFDFYPPVRLFISIIYGALLLLWQLIFVFWNLTCC